MWLYPHLFKGFLWLYYGNQITDLNIRRTGRWSIRSGTRESNSEEEDYIEVGKSGHF